MRLSTARARGPHFSKWVRAFTRLDLLAVLVAVMMLAAIVWPALGSDSIRAQRAVCANNLRRIGQALTSWAADHGELYPWLVSQNAGGTGGSVNSRYAYYQFLAVSNEVRSPSLFACPSDGAKSRSQTFQGLSDTYVSYMLSHPDVSDGRAILSGDRNIAPRLSSEPCPEFGSALWLPRPATNASWDLTIHANRGHLLFNDGTVESTDDARLRAVLSPPGASNNFHYIAP